MDEQPQQQTQEPTANPPIELQVSPPSSPEIQTPDPEVPPLSEPSVTDETPTQEPSTTLESQPQEPNQPESVPPETTLPTTTEQSIQAEPIKQETQERIVERTIPRELTEEEQQALYRSRLKTLSIKGNQSRSQRRLTNHAKTIEYLKQHGYITNNEVQKICKVKDSTATKYLKELQKLGQIIPVGRTSHIRWRLTQAI